MMWCPEISGDFLVCVLGGCFLFGCCFVSGAGAKTFLPFIFLVDLEHGAICHTILEYSLATISELEIHSGPNLLGNSKAYISSVFKRCRFCSSTVLFGVSDNL